MKTVDGFLLMEQASVSVFREQCLAEKIRNTIYTYRSKR